MANKAVTAEQCVIIYVKKLASFLETFALRVKIYVFAIEATRAWQIHEAAKSRAGAA